MNKRRWIPLMLAVFALGLFLPDILLFIPEHRSRESEAFPGGAANYLYTGTLEDRIRALTAYENASPNVLITEKTQPVAIGNFPLSLSGLMPEPGGGETLRTDFTLSPRGMDAAFRFTEYMLSAKSGCVRAIVDGETGKPVSVSLTGAWEALLSAKEAAQTNSDPLSSEASVSLYTLAGRYARLLGYQDISDLTDGNSYGAAVSTIKALVRAEPFEICITFSAPAGYLTYRLQNAEA